jgi:hypothetical protein
MLIQRVDVLGIDVYNTYQSLPPSDYFLLISNGGRAYDSGDSSGWIVSDDTE